MVTCISVAFHFGEMISQLIKAKKNDYLPSDGQFLLHFTSSEVTLIAASHSSKFHFPHGDKKFLHFLDILKKLGNPLI